MSKPAMLVSTRYGGKIARSNALVARARTSIPRAIITIGLAANATGATAVNGQSPLHRLGQQLSALTGYVHDYVNNTKKEYSYGEMHENRTKCLFSLFKPYLQVFLGISKANLPGYLGFF